MSTYTLNMKVNEKYQTNIITNQTEEARKLPHMRHHNKTNRGGHAVRGHHNGHITEKNSSYQRLTFSQRSKQQCQRR